MTSSDHSNRAFAHVLALARRRGFQAELGRQLALLGMPVKRQALARWLHQDPAKRIQPSFGAGLALLQAATMAEAALNRARMPQDKPHRD